MSTIEQRVAARWIQREAGLFDAPPAMVQPIYEWVAQTHGGNLLAQVEMVREKSALHMRLTREWNKLVDEREQLRNRGGDEDDVLDEMREIHQELNPSVGAISGKRKRKKRPGWDIKKDGTRFREWFVELTRIGKYLAKYTTKARLRKSRAYKNFDVDLTGWKYVPTDREHRDIFEDALYDAGLTSIRVMLTFQKKQGQDWVGYWDEDKNLLTLDAPSLRRIDLKEIQEDIANIKDTLIHELIHVGQTIIQIGKNLPEEAGLPGSGLRDPNVTPGGLDKRRKEQREDALHDVEFYTYLNDAVEELRRLLSRVPTHRRQSTFKKYVEDSTFFRALYSEEPRKYGKAVSELRKALDEWL